MGARLPPRRAWPSTSWSLAEASGGGLMRLRFGRPVMQTIRGHAESEIDDFPGWLRLVVTPFALALGCAWTVSLA